jgi:AcrR family transcriptional regulator
MPRQARSEATRKKIMDAAVELFREIGYSVAGLGDIIERAELTKGALYYHFDSKESLASAIIADAAGTVSSTVRAIGQAAAPALEKVIHSSFVVADIVTADPVVQTGAQLARALGEFNDVVTAAYGDVLSAMTEQLAHAATEGDLRAGLDPGAAAETLLSVYLGTELLSTGLLRYDSTDRLNRTWQVLLPALTADDSLAYFQEFLARETQRHPQHTPTTDP